MRAIRAHAVCTSAIYDFWTRPQCDLRTAEKEVDLWWDLADNFRRQEYLDESTYRHVDLSRTARRASHQGPLAFAIGGYGLDGFRSASPRTRTTDCGARPRRVHRKDAGGRRQA